MVAPVLSVSHLGRGPRLRSSTFVTSSPLLLIKSIDLKIPQGILYDWDAYDAVYDSAY